MGFATEILLNAIEWERSTKSGVYSTSGMRAAKDAAAIALLNVAVHAPEMLDEHLAVAIDKQVYHHGGSAFAASLASQRTSVGYLFDLPTVQLTVSSQRGHIPSRARP